MAIREGSSGARSRWSSIVSANLYAACVLAFVSAVVALQVADPFFVKALRLLAFDGYQRISPLNSSVDFPVRIVDIDESSLSKIGQWPWPRTILGSLVDRLREEGAATVAFDAVFAEADQSSLEQIAGRLPAGRGRDLARLAANWPSNDEMFAQAIARQPTVLGVTLSNAKAGQPPLQVKATFAVAGDSPLPFLNNTNGYVTNLPALNQAAVGLGSINWIPDRDGVVRRVPLLFRVGNTIVPSLAAEALRVAQQAGTYVIKSSNASGETAFGAASGINHVKIGTLVVPTDADSSIWLRYRMSRPAAFIPAWKVLAGKVEAHDIRGNIILVGTSAVGLVDLRATPLEAAVPGVEIQEQLIEHILSGQFLTRPDYAPALEIFVVVLLSLALAFLIPKVPAGVSALAGVAVLALLNFGGWALFRYEGLLFDSLFPSVSILTLIAGSTFYVYRLTAMQRSEIRRAFSQYVSPHVVAQLVASPERLRLGGEVRDLTVLFSDVRNFTSISEQMTAEELTTFINELLTPLSDAIMANGGTIDKYMGDAVMAFWNAPLADDGHDRHAVSAAIAMYGELRTLNERWRKRARDAGKSYREVAIGIGINSGQCCVGNLGSRMRFDYSAIGDEVNLASRFEGLTKLYGLPLVTGEATIAALGDLPFMEIDMVRVKGRDAPSRIFTLLSLVCTDDGQIKETLTANIRFLESYRKGDFVAASAALARCREVNVTGLEALYSHYEERVAECLRTPPGAGWDAVYDVTEK